MRIFARRVRPHPGARLSLFKHEDGYRCQLWVTNLPAATRGWRGQNAYIDADHPARQPGRCHTGTLKSPLSPPFWGHFAAASDPRE